MMVWVGVTSFIESSGTSAAISAKKKAILRSDHGAKWTEKPISAEKSAARGSGALSGSPSLALHPIEYLSAETRRSASALLASELIPYWRIVYSLTNLLKGGRARPRLSDSMSSRMRIWESAATVRSRLSIGTTSPTMPRFFFSGGGGLCSFQGARARAEAAVPSAS